MRCRLPRRSPSVERTRATCASGAWGTQWITSRSAARILRSCESVAELIVSEDLPCKEEAVVAAVRAWFEHDAAERASALKSLVPLIRWPLLPVAAQLSMWGEPFLVRMMIMQDAECCTLGLQLMSECRTAFAKSDAAACPRLKRRKGSVLPVVPLAFTAFRQEYYAVSEGGALLTCTTDAEYRPALCRERVMHSGKSCADVTVVRRAAGLMIGVARPTLDVNAQNAWDTADFWGMGSGNVKLRYSDSAGIGRRWQGMQGFSTGDVLRLLLDSDAGTLTVKKNSTLFGVAVTEGQTGDLCWVLICSGAGNLVRIRAVDPADF